MEKNIVSHDVSDMMVYEGMQAQARRFYFKQRFARIHRVIDASFSKLERTLKATKRSRNIVNTPETQNVSWATAVMAMYAITVASVLISFFWLALVLAV
jgi:hypothetical protein